MLLTTVHRVYISALNTIQQGIVRQKHSFDRALLKPKVRCHFPKPQDVKRINVHGWETRMSTTRGRRVVMQRVLKGRHDLSH